MLFPQEFSFIWVSGKGGGVFQSMCLAFVNRLLGGRQGICGRPVSHFWSREDWWSYSLHADFIGGVLKEDSLQRW